MPRTGCQANAAPPDLSNVKISGFPAMNLAGLCGCIFSMDVPEALYTCKYTGDALIKTNKGFKVLEKMLKKQH